ncbi:MAG: hypothetical protein OXC11_16560 [Rhodospirillales bacterium]|nr:hypothetical protein [Rhodospirillales bacterium]
MTSTPPTLNAWQKRWIAAEIASNLDAAWCDLPGPTAQLDAGHDFTKAAGVLDHACDELMAEADNECTLFVAEQLGITREQAEEAMARADFDREGNGWTFEHDGRTRHVYSIADGTLTLVTVGRDPEAKVRLHCEACGWEGDEGEHDPISNVWERMSPGDIWPWGDCPKCGAFVHEKEGD